MADGIDLDYGASIDSVTYVDRLNYLSPFARLTAKIGPGTLDIGYSSGAPPVDLLNAREVDGSLQADVAALNLLPQVRFGLDMPSFSDRRTSKLATDFRSEAGPTA